MVDTYHVTLTKWEKGHQEPQFSQMAIVSTKPTLIAWIEFAQFLEPQISKS